MWLSQYLRYSRLGFKGSNDSMGAEFRISENEGVSGVSSKLLYFSLYEVKTRILHIKNPRFFSKIIGKMITNVWKAIFKLKLVHVIEAC